MARSAQSGFGLHDFAGRNEGADGAGALARWIALTIGIDPGRGRVSAQVEGSVVRRADDLCGERL